MVRRLYRPRQNYRDVYPLLLIVKGHVSGTQVYRYLRYLLENINKALSIIRETCTFTSIRKSITRYRNKFRYRTITFPLQGNRIRLYFNRDKPLLENGLIYFLQ
jgi:hypothetical protein